MTGTEAQQGEGVAVPLNPHEEKVSWRAHARVEKWASQADYDAARAPYEVVEAADNILTNVGITRILSLMIGAGGTPYNNANCRLGVGNGSAPESASNTDLSAGAGSANRLFKKVEIGYPSLTGTVVTFRATYGETEANFRWSEWGVDNGTADGAVVVPPLLNRRLPRDSNGNPIHLGEKNAGVWTLTVTVTLA